MKLSKKLIVSLSLMPLVSFFITKRSSTTVDKQIKIITNLQAQENLGGKKSIVDELREKGLLEQLASSVREPCTGG